MKKKQPLLALIIITTITFHTSTVYASANIVNTNRNSVQIEDSIKPLFTSSERSAVERKSHFISYSEYELPSINLTATNTWKKISS